jgi:hypothetical protein
MAARSRSAAAASESAVVGDRLVGVALPLGDPAQPLVCDGDVDLDRTR